MNALSVVERAGRLITSGKKTLEIRHWRPGELPLLDLAIVQNNRGLTQGNPIDPDGQLVALVDVRVVREWEKENAEASCSKWEAGWLAWKLQNIRIVESGPRVPAKRRIYSIENRLGELKARSLESQTIHPIRESRTAPGTHE